MHQYKHRMFSENLPYLRLPHRTRFLAFAFYIYFYGTLRWKCNKSGRVYVNVR